MYIEFAVIFSDVTAGNESVKLDVKKSFWTSSGSRVQGRVAIQKTSANKETHMNIYFGAMVFLSWSQLRSSWLVQSAECLPDCHSRRVVGRRVEGAGVRQDADGGREAAAVGMAAVAGQDTLQYTWSLICIVIAGSGYE